MSRNYFSLPQFNPGDLRIDTSGINNALTNIQNRQYKNALMERDDAERTYQRGREAKQDARVARADKLSLEESLAKRAAAIGMLPPEQRGPAWKQHVSTHLRYFPDNQLDPEDLDPMTGPARYAAAFGGIARDPREDKLMDLKVRQAERTLAQPVGGADQETFYGSVQFEQTPENKVRGFIIGNRGTKKYIDAGEGGQLLGPEGVAAARASGAARGKFEGGAGQRNVAKERLTGQIKEMVQNYMDLDKAGGIVNPDRSAMENLRASASSSDPGQRIGGAVGSETQSIRRRITNMQPLLLQGIMQATGMGARAMDSNKELQFYLQAASDPTTGDIYSNLVALEVLSKTYGLGGVLDESLPPDVLARVKRDADRAIAVRPIPQMPAEPQAQPQAAPQASGGQPPVPGARQSPNDGNWYVPDPNRPGKYLRVE